MKYFLDTAIHRTCSINNLLHDERAVYMYLRHPESSTCVGLDEHKLNDVLFFTGVSNVDRYYQIIATLQEKNMIVFDAGLYWVPESALEKINNPSYREKAIKKVLDRFRNYRSDTEKKRNKCVLEFERFFANDIAQIYAQISDLNAAKKQAETVLKNANIPPSLVLAEIPSSFTPNDVENLATS